MDESRLIKLNQGWVLPQRHRGAEKEFVEMQMERQLRLISKIKESRLIKLNQACLEKSEWERRAKTFNAQHLTFNVGRIEGIKVRKYAKSPAIKLNQT